MQETEFESVLDEILSKVRKHGDINEMSSWREAYHDLEFEEVDESFTGDKINWDKRGSAERAFYVAYMVDPQAVKVRFRLLVTPCGFDQRSIDAQVEDSEKIWYMWMAGCFTAFSGDFTNISSEAKRTFLAYAVGLDFVDVIDDSVDNDGIVLEKLVVRF